MSNALSEGEVLALAKRAESGDPEATAVVSRLLDKEAPGFWAELGDLARKAQERWLELIAGENLITRNGIERAVADLVAEIEGPSPSALERLLAQRIAACWLQVHHADTVFAAKSRSGLTTEEGNYYQTVMDRAQRRYLAAIRSLAQVRRLLGPSVQINVGRNQLNFS